MWLFSDKRLSFFILVVLPLSISIIALTQKVPYFVFAGLAYLITALVYGFYPVRYTADQYFKDREPQTAITEYEFMKKIVYLEIAIVVVIVAITIPVVFIYPDYPPGQMFSNQTNGGFNASNLMNPQKIVTTFQAPEWGILAPINTFSYSVTGGIIWLATQTRKEYFDFYLAKAYFQIIDKMKSSTNKVSCLIRGVKSYDKYLRRSFNLQIDTEVVFSRIIGDISIDTNKAMEEISESLKNDDDKLNPIKSISNAIKIEKIEKILHEESLGKKLGDVAALLGTIVAILTSLIQIVLPAFGKP